VININHLHHPLDVCIRKDTYTREMGAGLGWVVIAYDSAICPELVVD
jgi:hypothetical protein